MSIIDFVYFTVADATSLGATADGDTTKADLYRANVVTGDLQLLSFQQNNTGAAMNGSYAAGSLLVSSDNRTVAFAYNVPSSSSGGLTFNQAGDGVFVVDTQNGSIRLVNWSGDQKRGSYGFWAGARPKAFTAGNGALLVESSYLSWTGSGLSGSGQYDKGLFAFDLASGAQTLLTRSPSSASTQAAATAYRGISPDGRTVFFATADASKFGNDGATFMDGATGADDLLAVSVTAPQFELLSGRDGVSLGSAVSVVGISDTGKIFYRSANVDGLPAGGILLSDTNSSGSDLIASSSALLDLEASGDSSGGASGTSNDNVTTARSFTLRASVLPNQALQLLDGGTPVSGGAATADSQGGVSWSLSNVALGTHSYSQLDSSEQIPVVLAGRPLASRLEITVIADSAAAPSSTSPTSSSLLATSPISPSGGTTLDASAALAPSAGATLANPSPPAGDSLTAWTAGSGGADPASDPGADLLIDGASCCDSAAGQNGDHAHGSGVSGAITSYGDECPCLDGGGYSFKPVSGTWESHVGAAPDLLADSLRLSSLF